MDYLKEFMQVNTCLAITLILAVFETLYTLNNPPNCKCPAIGVTELMGASSHPRQFGSGVQARYHYTGHANLWQTVSLSRLWWGLPEMMHTNNLLQYQACIHSQCGVWDESVEVKLVCLGAMELSQTGHPAGTVCTRGCLL